MGMPYDVIFTDIAVTALQDLFEVLAPSDSIVVVHGWEIFQTSDAGDSEEEILRLETVRGIGNTSGSGGATITPQPTEDGFAAAGGTYERNNTTRMVAGGGSLEILKNYGWNIRIPFEKIFTPETRPIVSPTDRWTLALIANPADSLTMSGTLTVEEIGG